MGEEFNYDELSPGIRNAVKWLHGWSWETTDSGDGSLFREGMECAMEFPMVIVEVADPEELCAAARMLFQDLGKALTGSQLAHVDVQAMFNPLDGVASILVTGKGLLNLVPLPPREER